MGAPMTRAPDMLLAVRDSVALLTPSSYVLPSGPQGLGDGGDTFFDVGSCRLLGESGKSREYAVTLNPGDSAQDTHITGITGTQDAWLRCFVIMRHENNGLSETEFSAIIADDHRLVMDGVCRGVRTAAPAGLNSIELDGAVSCTFDDDANSCTSVWPFRICYRDTIS